MFAWISENLGTIAVCLVIIAIVISIIINMYRKKKKGKSSCRNSSVCPMGGQCHNKSK